MIRRETKAQMHAGGPAPFEPRFAPVSEEGPAAPRGCKGTGDLSAEAQRRRKPFLPRGTRGICVQTPGRNSRNDLAIAQKTASPIIHPPRLLKRRLGTNICDARHRRWLTLWLVIDLSCVRALSNVVHRGKSRPFELVAQGKMPRVFNSIINPVHQSPSQLPHPQILKSFSKTHRGRIQGRADTECGREYPHAWRTRACLSGSLQGSTGCYPPSFHRKRRRLDDSLFSRLSRVS